MERRGSEKRRNIFPERKNMQILFYVASVLTAVACSLEIYDWVKTNFRKKEGK
jgi:hypothetical protein